MNRRKFLSTLTGSGATLAVVPTVYAAADVGRFSDAGPIEYLDIPFPATRPKA